MLLRASLLTGAVVLAFAGCGGSDDKASPTTVGATTTERATTPAPTTTAATTTTERATTTTPASTTTAAATTTAGPVITIGPGPLTAALLTAEDVGEGFVATRTGAAEPDDSTPCGTPSPSSVVGVGERDSVDIANNDKGLLLSQTIEQYADEVTAQQAMTVGKSGLACGSGTSTNNDGSTVKFDLQEASLPSTLGDESFAYTGTATVGDQTISIIFVAARDGRAVTSLTFQSLAGDQGPDVASILATAEQKLATVA